jgi:hypothetical protein
MPSFSPMPLGPLLVLAIGLFGWFCSYTFAHGQTKGVTEVKNRSSADDSLQWTKLFDPPFNEPVPLVVALRTWSSNWKQTSQKPVEDFCVKNGWAYLADHDGQEAGFVGWCFVLGSDFRLAGLAQGVQGEAPEVLQGNRAFMLRRSRNVPQGRSGVCQAFPPCLSEERQGGELINPGRNPPRAQGERSGQSFSPRL